LSKFKQTTEIRKLRFFSFLYFDKFPVFYFQQENCRGACQLDMSLGRRKRINIIEMVKTLKGIWRKKD
jgi:hypothetical protein